MTTLQQAWDVLRMINLLTPPETIPIAESKGRVAAKTLKATHDSPPFSQSRFDGYALGEPGTDPSRFRIITQSVVTAGDGRPRILSRGEAIPIMTGAPVPEGTHAILPEEWCSKGENGTLQVERFPERKRMYLKKGADFKKGDILLKRNETIHPIHVAFMALDGREHVEVFSLPIIRVVCSGDELAKHPKKILNKGEIRNSHPVLIQSILSPHGVIQGELRLPDSLKVLKRNLLEVLHSDASIVITTGGMGRGIKDLTRKALRAIGAVPLFEGINAIPIGTFSCYRYNQKVIFALPGGMVGVILLTELFVHPFVKKVQGKLILPFPGPFVEMSLHPAAVSPPTFRFHTKAAGIRFIKAYTWSEGGKKWVAPLRPDTDTLKRLNAFILLNGQEQKAEKRDLVQVFPLWNSK